MFHPLLTPQSALHSQTRFSFIILIELPSLLSSNKSGLFSTDSREKWFLFPEKILETIKENLCFSFYQMILRVHVKYKVFVSLEKILLNIKNINIDMMRLLSYRTIYWISIVPVWLMLNKRLTKSSLSFIVRGYNEI